MEKGKETKVEEVNMEEASLGHELEDMINELRQHYFQLGQIRANCIYHESNIKGLKAQLKELKDDELDTYNTAIELEKKISRHQQGEL